MAQLRIIGGTFAGRRFKFEASPDLRPTQDRVREAVSSMLQVRGLIEGAHVLDLFAGSGAYGLEMISRGATCVLFVDHKPELLKKIKALANLLRVDERTAYLRSNIIGQLGRTSEAVAKHAFAPFSLVFCDPRHRDAAAFVEQLDLLLSDAVLEPKCTFVFEHHSKQTLLLPQGLAAIKSQRYGNTTITLAQRR